MPSMRTTVIAIALGAGACGHGGGGAPDAPADDAGLDGPVVCAPDGAPGTDAAVGAAGTIAIHVGIEAGYGSGWVIEIDDSAGQQLLKPPPDTDLAPTVHGAATVSGIWGGLQADTYLDVAPGATLTFGFPGGSGPPWPIFTANATDLAGTVNYTFGDGDDSESAAAPSIQLECAPPCTAPHDVVALAYATPTDPAPSWAAAPAQTVGQGVTVTLGAWHPSAPFAAQIDGLPPGPAYAIQVSRAEQSSADVTPALFPNAFIGTATIAAGGTQASVSLPGTAFGGAAMVLETIVGAGGGSQAQRDVRTVATAPSYHLDAATLLPWIGDVRFDTCARAVTWTATGGRTPDGYTVGFRYGPRDPEEGYRIGIWTVHVAGDARRVTLPAPSSAGLPATGDMDAGAYVEAFDAGGSSSAGA